MSMQCPAPLSLLYGLVLVMLMPGGPVGVSADTPAIGGDMPGIKKDCTTCHVSHGSGSMLVLKKPVALLCIECHPDRKGAAEHKIDVVPSVQVPGLPLTEGRMTCITCHDPHSNRNGMMLRIGPEEICLACHKY